MSFGKVVILVILIIVLAAGSFLIYKKSFAQKNKNTSVLGTVADNWSVYSNEKYGYEVWCSDKFTCQYTCHKSDIEGEQFCASAKINKDINLHLSQQAVPKYGYRRIVFDAFGSSVIVSSNASRMLDTISAKMITLGATKLDSDKYNITGVARLDGFMKENNLADTTNITEEWFFVKNDLLYHATIKYSYNVTNKDSFQKLADELHNIFGTVSF